MIVPVSRVAARAAQRSRGVATYTDIVPSPPTVRISFTEKVGHGLLLLTGVLGYPFLAMFKVGAVKREEYAALEIPDKWAAWKERQQK